MLSSPPRDWCASRRRAVHGMELRRQDGDSSVVEERGAVPVECVRGTTAVLPGGPARVRGRGGGGRGEEGGEGGRERGGGTGGRNGGLSLWSVLFGALLLGSLGDQLG